MFSQWPCCCLGLALMLSRVLSGADDEQKKGEFEALLAKASVANLQVKNSPAFHLRLQFHAEHIAAQPLEGTLDEEWNTPDAWRREITLPDFKQVEVGDKDGRWVDRNLDFRPRPVFMITRLLDSLMALAPPPDEKVLNLRTEKKDGVKRQCADFGTEMRHKTQCFDETGRLLSIEYAGLRMEYSDYQKFADYMFPRRFKIYENRVPVLDAKVVDLNPASGEPIQFRGHSGSAFQISPCETWFQAATKKSPPEYPREARGAHSQGTVILYVLIAADGTIKKTALLQGAGTALNQAALHAVQGWRYSPSDCGTGHPLPTETEVSVNFALGP